MKRILLYLLIFPVYCIAQKPQAVIQGDYNITQKYNTDNSITIVITGLKPNYVYNMVMPTNYVVYDKNPFRFGTVESIRSSDNQIIVFVFNKYRQSFIDFINVQNSNNWSLLPSYTIKPKQYEFRVVDPYGGKPECIVQFTVR